MKSINNVAIKQKKIKYFVKVIIAVCVFVLLWEIFATIMATQGKHTAALAPSWRTIILQDLPSLSVFDNSSDSLKTVTSDWGLALNVWLRNIWVTVRRVLISMVLGMAIGVVSGTLLGINRTIRSIFYPVVKLIRNIPTLILISLFLVWFGGRESGIIIFITFSLWVIYCTSTIEALSNINPIHINFAKTLGAKQSEVYFNIIGPSIIPYLIDATRIAVGLCWAFALGGEYLIAQEGLGKILITSQAYMYVGRMIIIILTFIGLTAIGNAIVSLITKRAYRWIV